MKIWLHFFQFWKNKWNKNVFGNIKNKIEECKSQTATLKDNPSHSIFYTTELEEIKLDGRLKQ